MSAQSISNPTTWTEPEPEALYGVFDEDKGEFVGASLSLTDAQDFADDLERAEYDFGSRGGWFAGGKYFNRYSVDRLPSDHPLAQEVRA